MTNPTTPTKPKRAEYDTIRRTRFFDAYDAAKPILNFTQFCKQRDIALPRNTAQKWLDQRKQLGRDAYRRPRHRSKAFGRPCTLNENDVQSLLDQNHPLHDKDYEQQGEELGISGRTVR
jgi:hypothetical protein